ncbi:hypothetical protein Bra5_PD00794 (plasmid) [Rhizobium phaseoli Brasil 5]|nr:hypothetical protein Bra5_PD00794 [Rhizobium phaseoli Brasil 5]
MDDGRKAQLVYVIGLLLSLPFRKHLKDSKRFSGTVGWGYGQFGNGVANASEPLIKTCFASM